MQKKETRGQPTALTSGNIRKQLVLFAIPIFLGILLQQLYNVIDAVVAGRLVNEDALSAIGVSVPIYLLGAVMRSFGETKMPLYALVISSVINLVLNIVFVVNGGGVIGIAISTIIAQAISGWGYTDCRDSFTGIHTREIACHCIADRKIRTSLDCYCFLSGMVRGKCYCGSEIQGE